MLHPPRPPRPPRPPTRNRHRHRHHHGGIHAHAPHLTFAVCAAHLTQVRFKLAVYSRLERISTVNLFIVDRGVCAKQGKIALVGACLGEDVIITNGWLRDCSDGARTRPTGQYPHHTLYPACTCTLCTRTPSAWWLWVVATTRTSGETRERTPGRDWIRLSSHFTYTRIVSCRW